MDIVSKYIAYSEDLDGIKQFVQNNMDRINEHFRFGLTSGTLLHWSCYYQRRSTVEFLLTLSDIDVDVKFGGFGGFSGYTAKQIAEEKDYRGIVKLFDDRESNLNI
eukprot:TRINITY_DN2260_c0_g1_i2.p1 TRINITY_DN2260_c0_g1~~TRINITY_DN2260_c0_g1_i2.p1  ORF type:complete len:106 (-),score=22.22 TRINITY_DN2260_c0_g1_i2:38-355(-)